MLRESVKMVKWRDVPGRPVVKTPRSQCRGHGFDSLVRELRSRMLSSMGPKKKKKKRSNGLKATYQALPQPT